jgi:transposase
VQESLQQGWAAEMSQLLTWMHEAVKQAQQQGKSQLDPIEVADWKTRYQALLQEGYQANPQAPPAKTATPKAGRRKQSPALNLLDRLSKYQDAVLCFLECFSVPFDNSQAERDLRMSHPCSRKFLGAFAVCLELKPFVAFVAIFPLCANKALLC